MANSIRLPRAAVDSLSEAEVYEILKDLQTPHIPKTLRSGDVCTKDGSVHCTQTDAFASLATARIRRQILHRVVQDLALPLYTVESSLELVKAIRNVLVGGYICR